MTIKHGHRPKGKFSRTYNSWRGMKERCNNKNHKQYKDYGGRGIKVCDRWNDFINFLEDMGEVPKGLTIDRVNNEKGYSPENCKWSTMKDQNNNRRPRSMGARDNIKDEAVELRLNNKSLRYIAKELGSNRSTVRNAIRDAGLE